MRRSDVAVLVLAAGTGSRFVPAARAEATSGAPDASGIKLLALLDGRPVLQHVLDQVASLGPASTTVVLGPTPEAIQSAIRWRDERRVVNPHPEAGLAGSLRIGLAALADPAGGSARAALILLGDQPRVSPTVMRRLIAAAGTDAGCPFVAPRYADGGGPNPLLVRRGAWHLATDLHVDRGFGPLLAASPRLVQVVQVAGHNPDVDTPADLAALNRA